MRTLANFIQSNALVIKYGLLTGLTMIVAMLLTTSGPFAEQAWPKFIIPVITAGGILLFLKTEYDRHEHGLGYFRALRLGTVMSIIAFFVFSIALYFVLRWKEPHWVGDLHTGPFFMTLFAGLTGFIMNFIMVLTLLPLFKKRNHRFRSEQKLSEEY